MIRTLRGYFYCPLILLGAALLVGCGHSSDSEAHGPADTPNSSTEADESPAATPPASSVMASSPHAIAGIAVDLLEVARTGADAITIRWRYRNDTTEPKVLAEGDDPYRLTRDAYLADAIDKRYLLVTDEADRPVASMVDSDVVTLAPGEELTAWAKFPAPSTERLSIYLPHVDPFEDVAVEP